MVGFFLNRCEKVIPIPLKTELGTGEIGLIQNLGHVLFTEYVVPFEIASILFLSAMIGAVVIGKREVHSPVHTEMKKIETIQEEMNISEPVA